MKQNPEVPKIDLEREVALPKSQWSREFRDLIELRTKEKDALESEKFESEQIATYNRYLKGLQFSEDDLRDRSILDLGTGDGEFVRECLDREISYSVYGIDSELDESKLEGKYKLHLFGGDFQEKLPVRDLDYVISVGAVSNGIWGGEEVVDVEKVLRNSLDALKEDGEIRIYPIQESARETPLSGLEESQKRWGEILEKLSEETGVGISLHPVDIKVTGNENDIILEKVLIIKKLGESTD